MSLNRRSFLGSAAGAGTLALLPEFRASARESRFTTEQLEQAAAKRVLNVESIKTPVIIESIELLQSGRDYVVHVRSKDGAEGISVTNSRAAYLYPILNRLVIPYFIGKDARDLESHLFEVYRYRSNYKLQGLALWCPLSWVEFALLDMLGRIAGKSLGDLLGGVIRRKVAYYIASGRRDSTPEEEVDYLSRLVEETGAKAVKFRVGGRMSRNADAMPGRTENLIPLSRKRLGDTIAIHADSNSSYDPPKAIEVGKMLEDIGAVYFEEPCPFDHLEDTKRVTDALTIPVAGGEQEFSQRRFRWMIHNRGVDIVQPDLQYYGGLIRSARVANMAQVAGMPTTVHISGGLGFVYMLHFASRTPDIGAYQEYKRGVERYSQWFDPPLESKDGMLSVPTGPGVGIANIPELLKDAERVT
ncbi:MAG: mandelate racemase/muconate lactonizing enzyme family protein [Planctomycetes bacterium]|nr:mandelate racemase/muconate lactonizing enzyme family protein [Planctomycetota bacterium]MBL7040893.1 mandelate racemase/muconate lactonizing enzyme family protein [Pirellulaceae bacterium]